MRFKEAKQESGSDATTIAAAPMTTQAQLDEEVAEQRRLQERREDLLRRIDERNKEWYQLSDKVAAGDEIATARSRQARSEVADLAGEIASVDVVLGKVADRIAPLQAIRAGEVETAARAAALHEVETIEGETIDAMREFFSHVDAAIETFQRMERSSDRLSDLRLVPAVAMRGSRSQFTVAHRELLGALAAKHGGLEGLSFPLWMLRSGAM